MSQLEIKDIKPEWAERTGNSMIRKPPIRFVPTETEYNKPEKTNIISTAAAVTIATTNTIATSITVIATTTTITIVITIAIATAIIIVAAVTIFFVVTSIAIAVIVTQKLDMMNER